MGLQSLKDALASREAGAGTAHVGVQEGAGFAGKQGETYGGKQGKSWSEIGKKGCGEPASATAAGNAGTAPGDTVSSAKGGKEIAGEWWAKGTGKGDARFSPYAKGSGKAGK